MKRKSLMDSTLTKARRKEKENPSVIPQAAGPSSSTIPVIFVSLPSRVFGLEPNLMFGMFYWMMQSYNIAS